MEYEILRQTERARRRTIHDAIAVFEEELDLKSGYAFASGITAKVKVGGLRLPSRDIVGLVDCVFTNTAMERSFVVPLATSSKFLAKTECEQERRSFSIFRLDDAKISSTGDLCLADGMKVRAVEVVPARLPYSLTELERRIIRFTVSQTDEIDRCYPDLFGSLPHNLSRELPIIRVLDFSSFAENGDRPRLKISALKQIQANFLKANPDIKSLSQQKISDALSKAGLYIPIRRPKIG